MNHALLRREMMGTLIATGCLVANVAVAEEKGNSKEHIVLMGDSVFDNKKYTGAKKSVSEHLTEKLAKHGGGHQMTLLAVDGDKIGDMKSQTEKLKTLMESSKPTAVVISIGGNNALGQFGILNMPVESSAQVFQKLSQIKQLFEMQYVRMFKDLKSLLPECKFMISSIYSSNFPDPKINEFATIGLLVYNDIIRNVAINSKIPLLDLNRMFKDKPEYYANPIEPSEEGGNAITDCIMDFVFKRSIIKTFEFYN